MCVHPLNCLFVSVVFCVNALAGTSTKTHTYSSPLSVDGTSDYGVSLAGLDFVSGFDFPNTDEIEYVLVSITFHKTDGSCASPNNGNAYHGETTFRIDSPSGTNVILADDDTWTGGANAPTVTVIFSALGTSTPSGTPVDGTFLPNVGNLDSFTGESPFGTWVLRAGDDAGADPLCIYSYSITIGTYNPLPVELTEFSASLNESSTATLIHWTTASEINNNFYIIERSSDGKNWSQLGLINGAGNSSTIQTYRFSDNSPLQGLSYYRLKQIDYDGQNQSFQPVSIYNLNEVISIFTSNYSIYINGLKDESEIILYDISGKRLFTHQNISTDFVLENITKGIYLVKIMNKTLNKTEKIIVF